MTDRISWYKYVQHSERAAFEDLGWVHCADLGLPHSAYSSLYEWRGDGEPVLPASLTGDVVDMPAEKE